MKQEVIYKLTSDFEKILEEMEDLRDLIKLRKVMEEEKGETPISEKELYKELGFTKEQIKSIESGSEEEVFKAFGFTEEDKRKFKEEDLS